MKRFPCLAVLHKQSCFPCFSSEHSLRPQILAHPHMSHSCLTLQPLPPLISPGCGFVSTLACSSLIYYLCVLAYNIPSQFSVTVRVGLGRCPSFRCWSRGPLIPVRCLSLWCPSCFLNQKTLDLLLGMEIRCRSILRLLSSSTKQLFQPVCHWCLGQDWMGGENSKRTLWMNTATHPERNDWLLWHAWRHWEIGKPWEIIFDHDRWNILMGGTRKVCTTEIHFFQEMTPRLVAISEIQFVVPLTPRRNRSTGLLGMNRAMDLGTRSWYHSWSIVIIWNLRWLVNQSITTFSSSKHQFQPYFISQAREDVNPMYILFYCWRL